MHDETAASNPLAFVIAGALIIGVIGTALVTTNDVATPSNTGASLSANRQAQAEGLAQLLLETPGFVEGAGTWDGQGDVGNEGRLGLRHATVPYLDLVKFRNLKAAGFSEDATDGLVNYEEARQGFGLDGLDFHIRAYPTLQSVQDRLSCANPDDCKDPNLRVTYIGNLDEEGGIPLSDIHSPTCGKSPASDNSWRFGITLDNDGGFQTQFQVMFDLDFDGKAISRKDQSGLVPHGASKKLWVDVENQDFVTCDAATTMTVNVYDPSRRLTDAQNPPEFTPPSPATSPSGTVTREFYVELGKMHYTTADTIQVGYTGPAKTEQLHWEVEDALNPGAVVECFATPSVCSGNHTVPNSQNNQHINIAGLPEGEYVLTVTHLTADPDIVSTQRILIEDSPIADYENGGAGAQFDPAMATEVGYIHDLIKNFCPSHYNSQTGSVLDPWGQPDWDTTCGADGFRPAPVQYLAGGVPTNVAGQEQQGDVFWDDKSLMTDHLCKRLQYVHANGNCQTGNEARLDIANVLVVGSNVDQDSMTSGGFKWPLQAWVEAGGTLIVFGSPETSTEWLQPIFHVGEDSSSGPINAPDVTHPILAVPNTLDYESYDNQGKSWRYTAGAEEHFANVVNQGDDPVTAVSDPGSFGKGTVMISTWLPYNLYDGASAMEGMAILDNFLTHAYRDLFLDYGPMMPAGHEVIPALGRSQICHMTDTAPLTAEEVRACDVAEGQGLGLIDMDVALFVFR